MTADDRKCNVSKDSKIQKMLDELDDARSEEDKNGTRYLKNVKKTLWTQWKLRTPIAATTKGWDIWKKETKEKFPFRWYIQHTLPDFVQFKLFFPIKRLFYDKLYWGFKYRFIKKHQYHIVRTDLKPGYYDPVTLLLDVNFKILCDFVEFQNNEQMVDWKSDLEYKKVWSEMWRLYTWWKNEYPYREDKLEELLPYPDPPPNAPSFWVFDEDYEDTTEYKEWIKVYNDRRNFKTKWSLEDNANLCSIMNLREYLWY